VEKRRIFSAKRLQTNVTKEGISRTKGGFVVLFSPCRVKGRMDNLQKGELWNEISTKPGQSSVLPNGIDREEMHGYSLRL